MAAPIPSKLDQQQVLQAVLDETTGRLRVDAQISASIIAPPGLEVSILASSDNIAIRNTNNNNELLINSDGSIDVNATFTPNSSVNLNQIVGNPASVNNGIADNGTLRVAIASNNSPLAVTQSTSPWVISGTVTSNIGTTGGLALDSSLSTINTTISGLLTDTQLRASPVPISGTITALQGTSPWVISGAVTTSPDVNIHDGSGNSLTSQLNGSQQALDVGINVLGIQIDPRQIRALTSADVITVNQGTSPWVTSFSSPQHIILDSGTLTSITNAVTVSQPTAANLNATVVGTGTFLVQAAQSGTWNINDITGIISLPTGASTLAAQNTGNTTLASILSTQTDKSQFTKITDGSDTALVTAAGELNVLSTAQPGVDIGDVTINNGSGASAVNIQDGGNSITVDGSISFTAPQHVILDSGTLTSITNPVAVTQSTSPWVISGTVAASNFPATVDTSYGTVGSSTIRTASEVGNATGAANFNFGTVGAQTLRTAAQVGNATGAADFSSGATSAQTLRVAANTYDGSGNALTSTLVNSKQRLDVDAVNGFVSTVNSSTTPLAGNATFTGTYENVLNYVGIGITIFSDQNSAANGINIDYSSDGVNLDSTTQFAFTTTSGGVLEVPTASKFYRIRYVNGTSAQGAFRLQTILRSISNELVTAEVTSPINDNSLAALNRSVIVGHSTAGGGSYVNVKVTPSGAVSTSTDITTINGVTPLMGNGVTGTGSQRVTIASDNTAFSVNSITPGFATASNTRVALTNAGSTQLLAANANRKYAFVMNQTGKIVYLMLGAAAVGGQGILLSNGGMYEITLDNLWTGTINAISNSSTSASVDVFEGTI